MTLSRNEYEMILTLTSDPLMSMTELAEKLNISWPTAKKKYESLKERGILRTPLAQYIPEKLGLRRINVYCYVNSKEAMKIVERSCYEHPYTTYRGQVYCSAFGLFIQYSIPEGTYQNLVSFFDELKSKGYISEYKMFTSSGVRIETTPDIKRFDSETSTWDFSWEDWLSFENNKYDSEETFSPPEINDDFSEFKENHFKVLRAFTSNGALTQSELKKMFNLSRTEAHRQYNYVIDNYIKNVRIRYARKIFDLTETFLVICKNIDKETRDQLYYAIKKDPPPFLLAIDFLEDGGVLIWGTMSPIQGNNFAFSIWEKCSDVKIFTLNVMDRDSAPYSSATFYFYPENFDFEKMEWKVSKKYMVDEPMQRLEKFIEENNLN
ncbi:MAG: winged helix-turn-helix transcriptional regulator [Candidatus Kariarchaeaceae archaeon]